MPIIQSSLLLHNTVCLCIVPEFLTPVTLGPLLSGAMGWSRCSVSPKRSINARNAFAPRLAMPARGHLIGGLGPKFAK